MKNRKNLKIKQLLFEKLVMAFGLEKAEKIFKILVRLDNNSTINNSTTYGKNL